jgi:N-acetylmuramic acid 6-phosphate etherase
MDPVLDLSATPPTEQRNPRTTDIDLQPTPVVLALLHVEDSLVPAAVQPVLGPLAEVVDEAAERVRRGGRVHYFGAGSSGRIAVLDATELVPTFGLPPGIVTAHLAGGDDAMERAVEGAEDSDAGGRADAAGVTAADLVIGLSASGRTPYVAGALAASAGRGAFTAVVTCNPGSPLRSLARVAMVADTGPEAIAGSTRLKATSALKLILNSFSTALMVRLGRTYSNLMVEVSATNDKLRVRKVRILREASGAEEIAAEAALTQADGDLRAALVALLAGVEADRARQALDAADGTVRGALTALGVAQHAPYALLHLLQVHRAHVAERGVQRRHAVRLERLAEGQELAEGGRHAQVVLGEDLLVVTRPPGTSRRPGRTSSPGRSPPAARPASSR